MDRKMWVGLGVVVVGIAVAIASAVAVNADSPFGWGVGITVLFVILGWAVFHLPKDSAMVGVLVLFVIAIVHLGFSFRRSAEQADEGSCESFWGTEVFEASTTNVAALVATGLFTWIGKNDKWMAFLKAA